MTMEFRNLVILITAFSLFDVIHCHRNQFKTLEEKIDTVEAHMKTEFTSFKTDLMSLNGTCMNEKDIERICGLVATHCDSARVFDRGHGQPEVKGQESENESQEHTTNKDTEMILKKLKRLRVSAAKERKLRIESEQNMRKILVNFQQRLQEQMQLLVNRTADVLSVFHERISDLDGSGGSAGNWTEMDNTTDRLNPKMNVSELGVNLETNYMIRYTIDDQQGLPAPNFTNIRVGFRTLKKQGILLQLRNKSNTEYVSLEMNNSGGVKFIVDVGFERFELHTENWDIDLTDGQTHVVTLTREDYGRRVHLQVDNYTASVGMLGSSFSDVILGDPKYLYIGNNGSFYPGFEGCIFGMEVDGMFLLKTAFQDPTPPYVEFFPPGQICPDKCGFSLPLRTPFSRTSPNCTGEGPVVTYIFPTTPAPPPTTTWETTLKNEVGVYMKTNFMIRYTIDNQGGHPAPNFTNVRVGFRTLRKCGILFQARDRTNGNYISLEINNNGGVKFFIDVGYERYELNTDIDGTDVSDGHIHEASLRREDEGRTVYLQIDNHATSVGKLGASLRYNLLDDPHYLYVGNNVTDNLSTAFEGCIFGLQIDNQFMLDKVFQEPRPSYVDVFPPDRVNATRCDADHSSHGSNQGSSPSNTFPPNLIG